jgi:hypothetical protein
MISRWASLGLDVGDFDECLGVSYLTRGRPLRRGNVWMKNIWFTRPVSQKGKLKENQQVGQWSCWYWLVWVGSERAAQLTWSGNTCRCDHRPPYSPATRCLTKEDSSPDPLRPPPPSRLHRPQGSHPIALYKCSPNLPFVYLSAPPSPGPFSHLTKTPLTFLSYFLLEAQAFLSITTSNLGYVCPRVTP